jgi:hypothetical protein
VNAYIGRHGGALCRKPDRRHFGKTPVLTGEESQTAWIANTSRAARLASFGKTTHFEMRTGAY